jgi:hypothetical protein
MKTRTLVGTVRADAGGEAGGLVRVACLLALLGARVGDGFVAEDDGVPLLDPAAVVGEEDEPEPQAASSEMVATATSPRAGLPTRLPRPTRSG